MGVRWQDRSKIERVEWQNRFMLRAVNWLFLVAWTGPGAAGSVLRGGRAAVVLAGALLVVNVAQCLVVDRHARAALDQYLGRGRVPRGLTVTAGVLGVVAVGLVVALTASGSKEDGLIAMSLLFAPMPFACAYALLVPVHTFVRQAGVVIAVGLVVTALLRHSLVSVAVVALLLVLCGALSLGSYRCSAWTLAIMWESEHAREVEARLAVAEERLRFGRDLHDVMGRNLSVVALKSELAVQLARRGRTEDAVAQMTEVQRIAQESQKEVREVVRGYRDADLQAELVGARGVLDAAGIACTVSGSPAGLPAEVQSALGWVVREATTNVLRHGDPTACSIALTHKEQSIVLTVENDGIGAACPEGRGLGRDPDPRAGRGSGLAGLRERLLGVNGTLEARAVRDGVFRLTASVPVGPEPTASGAERPRAAEALR